MSPSPADAQVDSMTSAARPDRRATQSAAHSKPVGDNVCGQVGESRFSWHRSTLAVGLLGSLLLFAALPPLDWWPLAWVATLPWLVLIVRPRLEGRRPVLALYGASFAFWLATCHWVRLAHWAAYFGWVAMAAYLAVYSFLFLLLTRVAVHRLKISLVVAAPVIWTGLDVVRGYALGGFTMSSLAHTQYRWHAWIQLADVIGCYGLNGVVVLVSACLLRMMPIAQQRPAFWPVLPLALAFAVPLGYGFWRTQGEHTRPGTTVALIQGAIDTSFDDEPDKDQHVMQHYAELTGQARDQRLRDKEKDPGVADIALYVWPESMFRRSLVSFSEDFEMPAAMKRWANGKSKEEIESDRREFPGKYFEVLSTPVLIGVGREHFSPTREQRFNSAAFVSADGKLQSVYDKMQLVMFGEYIPLFNLWPALYQLTPMGEGVTPGERAIAEEFAGVWFAPNICYETVIPQFFRKQIHELRARGREPDVLVNLTNDGWFWGSSELDLHLMCGVFRAVECRKPLLAAANTGLSAWIDAEGQIVRRGPRREPDFILADVQLDDRSSFYLEYGGWVELIYVAPCIALSLFAISSGLLSRRRR